MDDLELGRFLRTRREALSPAAAGLPVGARRRTPGLRRAELATLAGISVDYLVRLEQGRDRRPSAQVLAALADALQLGDDDREHLRQLASITHTAELCPSGVTDAPQSVRPNVRAVVDRLAPTPAFVVNRLTDVLAWTATFEAIARPVGLFDRTPPNLVHHTFTDPRARTAYPDWDDVAAEQTGNLRMTCRPGDPLADRLVEEMDEAGADDFLDRWAARPVARKRFGATRLVHPEAGLLRIEFETLQLPDVEDLRLVVWLPGDEATAAAFDRLSGRRPGALRAVSG